MKKKQYEMDKKVPCRNCGGTGSLGQGLMCSACDGTGYVTLLESRVGNFSK